MLHIDDHKDNIKTLILATAIPIKLPLPTPKIWRNWHFSSYLSNNLRLKKHNITWMLFSIITKLSLFFTNNNTKPNCHCQNVLTDFQHHYPIQQSTINKPSQIEHLRMSTKCPFSYTITVFNDFVGLSSYETIRNYSYR